jgi:hypothetical protein
MCEGALPAPDLLPCPLESESYRASPHGANHLSKVNVQAVIHRVGLTRGETLMIEVLRPIHGIVTVALSATASLLTAQASAQAPVPAPPPPAAYSYADVADHAVAAATIVDVRIRRVREVEPARATGLAPGHVRLYVDGDVQSALYGRDPVARRVAWLVDLPRDSQGRAPRPPRGRMLVFARPVTVANQLVLVSPRAMVPWDASIEAHARAIAAELARGNVPPAITGIGQAFHVAGTVAGEGETQIFLTTSSGSPVSLTILRRPGQPRTWAAAFGEIVDEAAAAPRPGTIGHYRLACGLPATLPNAALQDASAAEAATARDDYAYVRSWVGPCRRGTAAAQAR